MQCNGKHTSSTKWWLSWGKALPAFVLSCNLNLVYIMDHHCYYLEGQMAVSILRLGYIWQIFSLLWTRQSCVWRERNKVIIASDKIWAFKWKSEFKKTCFHPCEPYIKTSLIRFAALSKKITFVNITTRLIRKSLYILESC